MTNPPAPPPFAPTKIYELTCAYWNTKVLLSAAEVGVFGLLGDGPATEDEIREKLSLDPTALKDFLDALVAMDLIERNGAHYSNGKEAEFYLVPGKRYFVGGYLQFVQNFMWPTWEGLTNILQNGKATFPHERVDDALPEDGGEWEGDQFFEHGYTDTETQRVILDAADALNTEIAWEMTRHIDWTQWKTIVDLGGARGNVAGILMEANPHLRATVFDMPPNEPMFDERMASLGLTERANFKGGDWFADPLPAGDALLCGHALHNWSTEQRRTVIEKAFQATNPGGALLVYDLMIDEDRSRLNPLLLSLLMRLGMGGSGYTASECRELMAGAGFTGIETVTLNDYDGHTVVIGHKAP